MIAIPSDLTGEQHAQLVALLDGRSDFFSAAIRVNGRVLTMMLALQDAAPTAQIISAGPAAIVPVVTGTPGSQGSEMEWNPTMGTVVEPES